jgi:hypothetical protein
MSRKELFCRGLVMPGLVALNVVALTARVWPLVFVTSFGISYVWAGSVKGIASSVSDLGSRVAYAGGAGCGAVLGMLIGGRLA